MDTIKNYLETMFQSFPNTPEVRKAKDDLFTQMNDNYFELIRQGKTENEAIGLVISNFGNVKELSEKLGLQTPPEKCRKKHEGRTLSPREVTDYKNSTKRHSMMIGIGVMLCIFSVIPLLLFSVLPMENPLSEAIGCVFLFIMIAIAVALFILSGMGSQKYEFLKKELFQLDSSVEAKLRSEKEAYQRTFSIQIAIGVCLCIISVIPPIVAGILSGTRAMFEAVSVILLLLFVGIAVYLFITSGMKMDCYKVLLQEDEYSKETKKNELTGIVASIYWPIITCLYLGYSFITGNWMMSWIIWPISGVLFGSIACICNLIEQSRTRRMR